MLGAMNELTDGLVRLTESRVAPWSDEPGISAGRSLRTG